MKQALQKWGNKMKNPNNDMIEKMRDALEDLKLEECQIEIIESYLSGETEKETLQALTFQDLSKISSDQRESLYYLFRNTMNKGKIEEQEKLFEVLFAIGQSTCYEMFPIYILNTSQKYVLPFSREKLASICAEHIGNNQYWIQSGTIKNLFSIADNDPEIIKKALAYHKSEYDNGKLVLYAAYFLLKYPEAAPNLREGKQGKGLNNVFHKLIGGKEPYFYQIAPEDKPLLADYEAIEISSLNNLFNKRLSTAENQQFIDAVEQNHVNEEVLRLASNLTANDFLLTLLGACAYMNYVLSPKLHAMVAFCAAANAEETLNILEKADLRNELRFQSGNFDKMFQIPAHCLISWAARHNHKHILTVQFQENRQIFLEVYHKEDFDASNVMLAVIKTQDSRLYQDIKEDNQSGQQDKMIQCLLPQDPQAAVLIKDYLRGNIPAGSLYPQEALLRANSYYSSGRARSIINSYLSIYPKDEFVRRCQVLMVIQENAYFFTQNMRSVKDGQKVCQELFSDLEKEGVDMLHQLKAVILIDQYLYEQKAKNEFENTVIAIFEAYLQDKQEEVLWAFQKSEALGRCFGLKVMERHAETYQQEILSFAQDSAKMVREQLLTILQKHSEWEEAIFQLLQSKKASEREMAVKVLLHWNQPTYQEMLQRALDIEKNGKVRKLLEDAFDMTTDNIPGERSQEEVVKELHKGGKKRGLAWAYETPFSKVYKKNGEEADTEYLQALLLCYSSLGTPGFSKDAMFLAEPLEETDLALYMNELFDKWLDGGAESKKKWVLYAASIHGGGEMVKRLQQQIQQWPQHSRGAIAAEAVQALALSPAPQALLTVDSIARKFKFKQVKAAASKALEFAAAQLNLTREELADKIVPSLGFDENMERKFDYGSRSFTITITPALEIEIFGEDGKRLKNMPAPGKKDDEKKAAAAYSEFKLMKKQMKDTVASQRQRLEQALSTERLWTIDAWKELFVKNPVMHQFAIGLIWGIYEERTLKQTFRYMEDGSFNTEEEEELLLPVQGKIGLVHPIELTDDTRQAWVEQLADYEVLQPFEQLSRPIYYVTEEEKDQKCLERFGGCLINDLSLSGKLQSMGWYHGSVEDAGVFFTFYREDSELGLGVELRFSGTYIGGENTEITVYDASFYDASTVPRGSYVYDWTNEEKSYALGKIPPRYFSEVVLQLTRALATSQERNENWKLKR